MSLHLATFAVRLFLRNMVLDSTRIKIPLGTFFKTSQYHVTDDVIINGHTKILASKVKINQLT